MFKVKKQSVQASPWCSAPREDLQNAVECLRTNFFTYTGPFLLKSGVAVFKISNYLLTVDELVSLHKSGQLTKEGIAAFAKCADTAEKRLKLEPNR